MDRIQTVIAGAGVLCFLWFAAPLVANGILNLGNLTGMGMSALLIIYGVGQKRIHVYIAEIARARSGRVILLMICAMAALVAGNIPYGEKRAECTAAGYARGGARLQRKRNAAGHDPGGAA